MRAGDRVELRSPAEILATLDPQGSLEGVPFMPEMLEFFGRAFTVEARVERACDTIAYTGPRRLADTLLLDDLRCNGSAHAGCGTQCRLYWKEAWLRPEGSEPRVSDEVDREALLQLRQLATANVHAADSTPESPTFRCQATELIRASEPVGWYRVLRELRSGNVGLWSWMRVTARIILDEIGQRLGLFRYEPFGDQELKGRRSFVDPDARTLQPGELVRVRTKREIRDTLAENGKNRGLWFDREMVPYCGHTARVRSKVERFIDEGSGKLVELESDCYILDGVVCGGQLSENRWFCPRALYPWWRESWLQPVDDDGDPSSSRPPRGT
jgi:hypothetical protein